MHRILALLFIFSTEILRAHEWKCGQVSLHAEYLYWTARQEGLEYTNEPSPLFTSTNFTSSDLISPSFNWNSGFRLGAAFTPQCSTWQGELEYTQLSNSAYGCQKSGDTEGIFPALLFDAADNSFVIFPEDYVDGAKSKWNLNTYILDIVARHEISFSRCASITPIIGLRNAWINQKIHAHYTGGGLFTAGPCDASLQSKFYGVGPKIGIKPAAALLYNFNLYAEAAASLFFSQLHTEQSEWFLKKEVAQLHKKRNNFRWNGDLKAGLNWTHCTGKYSTFADLGFDYLYFSKQYEFEHGKEFSLPKRSRILQLFGIHFSCGIQF